MELTYRQKQQLLVSYRNDGYELEVKLNVKSTVLDAEIARIELMMGESVITEDITLEDLEASQLNYETILPSSTVGQKVESTISPTRQPQLEPVTPETTNVPSTTNQAVNAKFRESSSLVFLMTPLALIVAGMIIGGIWVITSLSTVLVALVKYLMPRVDKVMTWFYSGMVNVVELLFGSGYDEHYDSYLEIKHLLRN